MKTCSQLLDELYERVGPERYEAVRVQVADRACNSVKDIAAIRDAALTAYCKAEVTYNKQWQEAWASARDEILAAEGIE
jgi:hypothetical protein